MDMYIKLETSRLDFFFCNKQHEIRSGLYQGIVDSVHAGETQGNNLEICVKDTWMQWHWFNDLENQIFS